MTFFLVRLSNSFHRPLYSSLSSPLLPPASSSFHSSPALFGPKAKQAAKPAAAPTIAKATSKVDKQAIRVETDPEILARHCCIKYRLDDPTPGPELREDDYYPDWLWNLDLTVKPHFELDDRTPEYWQRKQKAYLEHKMRLRKAKPFGIINY